MKKTLFAFTMLVLVNPEIMGQKNTNFSNVHCLLLINYAHGLSTGEYVYSWYQIKKDATEFRIKAEDQHKHAHLWHFPVPLDNKKKTVATDSAEKKGVPVLLTLKTADRYYSVIEHYAVNDTVYTVYKHINYNCYDPFCGQKHGHVSAISGTTYFSPDYGILVRIDNSDMQFDLMTSIQEKKVPYGLVVEILKRRKTDQKIIEQYIAKTR